MRSQQTQFFKNEKSFYGGEFRNTRKERGRPRPLSTRETMHLVLRSTQAVGKWSFLKHRQKIERIITRFAEKNGVRVLSLANVGNHLHLHVKLGNRFTYPNFIRAITSAIAMAVTGCTRWTKEAGKKLRFWDYRPFSRVVIGLRGYLTVRDYIKINQLEAQGLTREQARAEVVTWCRRRPPS